MALFGLRQYKIRPGKMDAWLKLMQEEVMPFQVSKGAVITAMFQGESDDSLFSGFGGSKTKRKEREYGLKSTSPTTGRVQ